jgi:hypothetical protein
MSYIDSFCTVMNIQTYLSNVLLINKIYTIFDLDYSNIIIIDNQLYYKNKYNKISKCDTSHEAQGLLYDILYIIKHIDDGYDIIDLYLPDRRLSPKVEPLIKFIINDSMQNKIKKLNNENKELKDEINELKDEIKELKTTLIDRIVL